MGLFPSFFSFWGSSSGRYILGRVSKRVKVVTEEEFECLVVVEVLVEVATKGGF